MKKRVVGLLMRGGYEPSRREVPVSIHRLPALERLAEEVTRRGYRFAGPDELSSVSKDEELTLLWDFGSVAVAPGKLIRRAEGRVVAWSLESPLVAHRAYHRLHRIAEKSAHIFAFPGAAPLVPEGKTFHGIYWPNEPRQPTEEPSWKDRDFLVMINSSKTARQGTHSISIRRPYASARVMAAAALSSTYRLTRTWSVPNLYAERVKAIAHFGRCADFALYGVGWDRFTDARVQEIISRAYRGFSSDKHETLCSFRFAVCFENTVFPGYITEKIFDPMFAGTIPVYLGAPDVHEYVPTEAFVDVRAFPSFHELEDFLRGLSSKDAEGYRRAAREYVASASFNRFTSSCLAGRFSMALQAMTR